MYSDSSSSSIVVDWGSHERKSYVLGINTVLECQLNLMTAFFFPCVFCDVT